MTSAGPPPRRPPRDPFRVLAIVSIVMGMLIVAIGTVLFYAIGAQSALIMGAGVTLAIGGGLPNMLGRMASQIPDYEERRRELDEFESRRRDASERMTENPGGETGPG